LIKQAKLALMDILFELRGLLKALFLPPGIFLLVLAFALGWGKRRPRLGLAWVALLVLAVSSTPVVSNWAVRSLEQIHPVLDAKRFAAEIEYAKPQAIVILGGGLRLGALEEADLAALNRHSLERTNHGARLHRLTSLPILVSGGIIAPAPASEAQVMERVLQDNYGIRAQWIERNSINTRENAQFSAVKLKRDGVTRILLVTSALHMARSVVEFEREGITVVPAASGYYASGPQNWRSFLPGLSAAQGLAYSAHEWVGLLWYRLSALWNPVSGKTLNV
jgi:uncharacterized SAM-binding protein YcdF (DUF218 family)